ncbi:YbhB/YbcL family Raf kinase inhibitor-like protein [Sphingomonas sanguinis]|uniref:YbhB/YbcL family Raf kinase inhibitor-like protein n=1 Tax=Sphingomonas sp. LC-1 TaxID=3110957 RepID=UPI0021BAD773|nr:YbhB/YbcL family Raf kinase inhibitor-like protein [Sphingomonas sp. LC-1]MCT8000907.1 YbhB/YbcL family Raf kinase inhibitor-like protein [Sphingomonas sp. LC-1]
MLEHLPAWLGKAMSGWRAGVESIALVRPELAPPAALSLHSPAFGDMARLPERFTADGEGVSPPLVWGDPPSGTAMLALLVEDADAPTPQPLVHAILWKLPPHAGELAEGAIAPDGTGTPDGGDVGRNSYLGEGWLPPDPPRGHGEHRYVFQLFALDHMVEMDGTTPGRSALVEAMAGHVLAAGVLTGTYSREEEAPVGPVGAVAPA